MTDAEILIIDDLLDDEAWTEVWTMFQFADLAPVTRTAGAWKLDDGVPLGGDEIVTPARDAELGAAGARSGVFPSGTALDRVVEAVLERADEIASLVGSDWAHLTARAYAYPAGSALSWHGDDSALYTGAFVYYAHPHWNAHWGGELLAADAAPGDDLPIMAHRFDDEAYSAALLERGSGRFVMARPNRLVVLGSAPHMVAPVRAAAGSHVRASVSGFFLRDAIEESE
ncbi:MAG: 2OG-Fe(II) oxygenase [Planctomycetota bacterium]